MGSPPEGRVKSGTAGYGRTMIVSAPTTADLPYLRRCVDLARAALDEGDEPFGSLLVHEGVIVFEDRNRVSGGDATRHPEFEIARWAAEHLTPAQRAAALTYTSGEHCASAAPRTPGSDWAASPTRGARSSSSPGTPRGDSPRPR